MNDSKLAKNRRLVLDALEAAYTRRTLDAYECFWSQHYIEHSARIGPGRDGFRAFVARAPGSTYEPLTIVADGDLVMAHGRVTGSGPLPRIVVDIFRVADGMLAEHWDVAEDDVS